MNASETFALAERIAADTEWLHSGSSAELLLLNDSRWPWVMLVPRVPGARELHDLPPPLCAQLFEQVRSISEALQSATDCTSINVAALGNVVSQLHVHIVARHPGDPAWPGPVWGIGSPLRRQPGDRPAWAARAVEALKAIDTV